MAARHLRRLRGDDDLGLQQQRPGSGVGGGSEGDGGSSSGDASAPPTTSGGRFNPFDLLDDGEAASPAESSEDGEAKAGAAPLPAPPSEPAAATKKKARKKKGKAALGDEVDAALAELGITAPAVPAQVEEGGADVASASLLAVDARSLRGDDETRRLFGDPGPARGDGAGAAAAAPGRGAMPGVRRFKTDVTF